MVLPGKSNVNSERYLLQGNAVWIAYDLASQFEGTIDGDRIFFTVTSSGTPSMYMRNFVRLR